MFVGKSVLNLDSKGRLGIPAKMRELLNSRYSGKLVLTSHTRDYISGYPLEEWILYEERLKKLQQTRKTVDFIRIIYSRACDCSLDSQGRVLIPPSLRERAGIVKEAVVLGIMNKIEIWDHRIFNEYNEKAEEDLEVPDEVREIGFT